MSPWRELGFLGLVHLVVQCRSDCSSEFRTKNSCYARWYTRSKFRAQCDRWIYINRAMSYCFSFRSNCSFPWATSVCVHQSNSIVFGRRIPFRLAIQMNVASVKKLLALCHKMQKLQVGSKNVFIFFFYLISFVFIWVYRSCLDGLCQL